jgi:hypothetical protein
MRRHFLLSTALVSLAPTLSLGANPDQTAKDRLVGVWRSDADRTVRDWKFQREMDDASRQRFASVFGKMTWRITPSSWISEYNGTTLPLRYKVVDSDSRSVVVRHLVGKNGQAGLSQYFFDEENYLYVASGTNFEFFKRVEA